MVSHKITETLRQMVALTLVPRMGAVTFKNGLMEHGSLERFFQAKAKDLKAADEEIEATYARGMHIVHFFDEAYPAALKNIFDPPILLYVKGELPSDNDLAVGVVGSRDASLHGLKTAEAFGRDLAGAGVVVVSGMARGIDTAAHTGALKADGVTIAVLGGGIGHVMDHGHKKMIDAISKKGAIVSEFPLRMSPDVGHFPMRNRIISGLSRGLVVVEAREKSGALITAGLALEQGRDVFAVPANESSKSKGSNWLLKQGARFVTCAEDILNEYGVLFKDANLKQAKKSAASSEEKGILDLFDGDESLHVDEIVEKTRLAPSQVLMSLTMLQIKGALKELPGKYYTVRS
jgi:DNA processing protein